MKLALRASMGADHPDLGADSVGSLPLRQWVHVAFTFENRSATAEPPLAHPFAYG
jgi:hypothetical protein